MAVAYFFKYNIGRFKALPIYLGTCLSSIANQLVINIYWLDW